MYKYITRPLISAAALLGLGAGSVLLAQTVSDDLPGRQEIRRADLTGAPGMQVIASIIEVRPGESAPLHHHHGVEVAHVLDGGTILTAAGLPSSLEPGTTLMNLRDVAHAGFTNTGSKPIRFFNVLVVEKSKPLFDFSR